MNMRVALLSSGFIDYTIQLTNSLVKKGIKVLLIVPDDQILEFNIIKNMALSVCIYTQPKKIYNPANILLNYKLLRRIIAFNPDIIHVQGGTHLLTFILPLLHKKFSLILTFHDIKPHIGENTFFTRICQRIGRRYSDQIFVHGKTLKEQMIEEYSFPSQRIHVIPIGEHNVSPFRKYEKLNVKTEENIILFFGRIWEYKGLEYLIKAEPFITEAVPDAKIIIAGVGENFDKYENMMVNRDQFIVYNYRIPYEEGFVLWQKCSLVVLPYIDASQSGIIPVAYGFKKPVVVTNVGALPEIVDDGITGLIVEPRDSHALAGAIIKLLKDKRLRFKMGENGYKKLKRDLSWDKIAEKTIQVYKKCLSQGEHTRRSSY